MQALDQGVVLDYMLCCSVGFAAVSLPLAPKEHRCSLYALALFVGLIAGGLRNHYEETMWLANPWGLGPTLAFATYVFKIMSIHSIEYMLAWGAKYLDAPLLQYRVVNNVTDSDHKIVFIDKLYLFINTFLETIFLFHLAYFAWFMKEVKWSPSDMTLLNTLPAFWLLLVVNDIFYAPLHLLMHHRWLYAFVHKHHHRSFLPSRYYLDAGNDHPWEQVGGLSCLWVTLHLVAYTTGIHIGAMACQFTLYLCMQILNHSPYDIQFSFLGIKYESGLHELHHRIPNCNMAQYFMVPDKLMGTYRPYSSQIGGRDKKVN